MKIPKFKNLIVTTQVTWSQSSIIIYDKRIYTEEKRRDTIGE